MSEQVLELVTLQKVFTPKQIKTMLGVGRTTYYDITRQGLLKFSRVKPNGPRIHTQKQYDDYLAYLNRNRFEGSGGGQVAVAQRFPRRRA